MKQHTKRKERKEKIKTAHGISKLYYKDGEELTLISHLTR